MQNKFKYIGVIAWVLGSFFFLSEYFVRVSTGVLSNILFTDFHVDATAVGLLSAYFYYAYIFMQIPVGVLFDRFGAKYLLGFATIIFGLACVLFAQMDIISTGYLARFIMGFAGAFAFVGTLKLITVYFPRKFAFFSGITQGLGMVGAVIGAAPMAYLFGKIGWRASFYDFAIVFILIGLLMLVLIKSPEKKDTSSLDKHKTPLWQDIKLVLSSWQMWLNCLFIGFMYAPTEIFGEQWGTLFIERNSGLGLQDSALQVSFIFIGMAVGCPAIGAISDYLHSRVKVMRWCALLCFALISVIIYGSKFGLNISNIQYCIIMFIYGVSASTIIPSYAIATELNESHVAGLAIGITNMATGIIGAIFIPLIGFILDKLSMFSDINTPLKYSLADFQIGFVLLPICFLLCFLLSFVIKDKFNEQ